MAITCQDHKRRVEFDSKTINHRNGDKGECDSKGFLSRGKLVLDADLRNYARLRAILGPIRNKNNKEEN